MKLTSLSRLAVQHARNHLAEEVYLRSGKDGTRPISFYGLVNERCNVRCRYCEFWRLDNYQAEMSIAQWQQALLSIKEFVGKFSISFSGGEPFMKKGFVDLLAWCREQEIEAGVTTNGSALSLKMAARIVAARPLNVNISCDGPDAQTHDYLRGWPGLFDTLSAGIGHLRAEQRAQGIDFPIVIKPTVNKANFRTLPHIVRWAERVGATAVNFQPMHRSTQETYDELWIESAEDFADLERVTAQLCEMHQRGHAIVNSPEILRLMAPHFREERAPAKLGACRVGLRDFFIRTNGDVELCFFYPVVGNIREQSAREIWYGDKARAVRGETIGCDKLCLFTCLSQKTLADKVKMGVKLLKSKRGHAIGPAEPALQD
ncbi:MAG: radical SAM protein [Gammaproteobacteria bacterium]|nr:radical SAM protein [Gammaproteobacteria bacterium]